MKKMQHGGGSMAQRWWTQKGPTEFDWRLGRSEQGGDARERKGKQVAAEIWTSMEIGRAHV